MVKTENAVLGIWPVPDPLDWNRRLLFLEPDLNKEPTLLPTRTKLESVFTADNRIVFEWEVRREKPHDFLGRRKPLQHPAAAPPPLVGTLAA